MAKGTATARLAGAALAAGLTFGLRDSLQPVPDAPIVVVDEGREEPLPVHGVTLFFHPQVPEATLVLVR
jgi:hypothetical protein